MDKKIKNGGSALKEMMPVKIIVRWLCGIWAFGLGLRLTHSLCIYPSITIPSHWINIYFDFMLLGILGALVMVMETREMCERIRSRA